MRVFMCAPLVFSLCFTVATRSVLLICCLWSEESADKSLCTFSYAKTTVPVFCCALIDSSPVRFLCKSTTARGHTLHYTISLLPEQACVDTLFYISLAHRHCSGRFVLLRSAFSTRLSGRVLGNLAWVQLLWWSRFLSEVRQHHVLHNNVSAHRFLNRKQVLHSERHHATL